MTEKTINRAYEPIVQHLFANLMGDDLLELQPNPSYPDSIVYTAIGRNQNFVFKMIDPDGRDRDRISAEAWSLQQAHKAGVPVPEVVEVDASRAQLPSTYMLMTQATGTDLRTAALSDEEMRPYLLEIGRILRQLHTVQVDGFGRLESQPDNTITGNFPTWRTAATEALEPGLAALYDNNLIEQKHVEFTHQIVAAAHHWLDQNPRSLLHGDMGMIHTFANLKTKNITALIDFGECKSGDPVWEFVDLRRKYVWTVLEGYGLDSELEASIRDRYHLYAILRNLIWAVRWHNIWPESASNYLTFVINDAARHFGLNS